MRRTLSALALALALLITPAVASAGPAPGSVTYAGLTAYVHGAFYTDVYVYSPTSGTWIFQYTIY